MNEKQPTDEELRDYRMPKIPVGENVLFYANAEINSLKATIGVVARDNVHSLDVVEINGNMFHRAGVRHVSDPRLRMNQDQRAVGAWDYTPAYLEMQRRLDEIDENLETMNNAFIGAGKSDREYLMFHCKRLGLTGYSTKSSDVVRQMIEDAIAGKEVEPDESELELATAE